jgi:hypothetical protein
MGMERKIIKWTPRAYVKNKYGQPRCFAPPNRSSYVIYAVVLRDHPDIVKIGRTTKWHARRKQYAEWNLAKGDGIAHEVTFCINEEFIDLVKLENEILARMQYPLAHGHEWFSCELEQAVSIIEALLCEYEITYDKG